MGEQVQEVTDWIVALDYINQDYTIEDPAAEAEVHGIEAAVDGQPETMWYFASLPRRWVVERSFAERRRSTTLRKTTNAWQKRRWTYISSSPLA